MIPIHLDLSEVVAEFSLTGEQATELGASIISRIVTEYTSKWEDIVDKNLRQTRKIYKRAMYVDRISPTEVIFGLSGGEDGLALALEEGKDAYDEKPYFAASPKRKTKKLGNGWYLTVPLGTPLRKRLQKVEFFSLFYLKRCMTLPNKMPEHL